MRPVALLVLVLACVIVAAPAATQDQTPSDWVKARAIPLKTVVPGNGFDDLRPLASVIGSARIVSLGEATHGSREFFQLKHRMLEFLATEMGFTIFSIEANMPESYRLNDYVLNGTGDPAALLKGIYFWTWDTDEVLAMITWMREFNASGKGRVQFTGFDMQTPTVAAGIVDDFVAKRDPDLVDAVRFATRALKAVSKPASSLSGSSGLAVPPPASVVKWWNEVVAGLEAGRAKYRTSGASNTEITWAIQNARVVLQCAQMWAKEVGRDRSMAENVKWILDQNPTAKIVLWAHNGHVAAGSFDYETMGAALRRMYGAQMLVFGFAFNEGSFRAIPQGGGKLRTFTVPAAPADSLDGTLAASRVPLFALDLRQAPAWFREPRRSRLIGSIYPVNQPYAYMMNLRPAEAYDVMLFVDKTTAAVPNPPSK